VNRFAWVLAALAAACSTPPQDRETEQAVSLPAYPRDADLIQFGSDPVTGMRFLVDGASVAVPGKEGIVRYTLVARSPEGARTVSYESLACPTGQYRVHALGRPDGRWGGRESDWRAAIDSWHRLLYREYFCPQNEAIRNAEDGVRALRDGGHPFSRGFGAPGPINPR